MWRPHRARPGWAGRGERNGGGRKLTLKTQALDRPPNRRRPSFLANHSSRAICIALRASLPVDIAFQMQRFSAGVAANSAGAGHRDLCGET